jgi:hypothetical protein
MIGTPGSDARRGLVNGREMVEEQRIGVRGSGVRQSARPGVHLALEGVVVECCEHLIWCARPVLVGGLHRRSSAGRIKRSGRSKRFVERHATDIQAGIEGRCVAE